MDRAGERPRHALGLVWPSMPRIWVLPPWVAPIIHPTSHIGAVYRISFAFLSVPRRCVVRTSRSCRGQRRVGYEQTAPFLDRARQPTGLQAGDVLGSESKTLECQLRRPGVPAARFKCRDLLPVEALEFLHPTHTKHSTSLPATFGWVHDQSSRP